MAPTGHDPVDATADAHRSTFAVIDAEPLHHDPADTGAGAEGGTNTGAGTERAATVTVVGGGAAVVEVVDVVVVDGGSANSDRS